MKKRIAICALGLAAATAQAQSPSLVTDIRLDTVGSGSSSPTGLVSVGDNAFFWAYDDEHGDEPRVFDGTTGQVRLLGDLTPGPQSSGNSGGLEFDGRYVFAANDLKNGIELWISDGTSAGTKMTADIWPGSGSAWPRRFIKTDNALYFFARTESFLRQSLWRLQSGSTEPQQVAELTPPGGYVFSGPGAGFGDGVVFAASIGVDSDDPGADFLMFSDGSQSGTTPVASYQDITSIGAHDDFAVFFARTETGSDFYSVDSDLAAPQVVGALTDAFDFQRAGDVLIFRGRADGTGDTTWRTDGTTQGTFPLTSADSPVGNANPERLVTMNGLVYFIADGFTGKELWVTNGTQAGTSVLLEISDLSGAPTDITGLAAINDVLYFNATTAAEGTELWQSDGTAAGTAIVADVAPDALSSQGEFIRAVEKVRAGSQVAFVANDHTEGAELWVTGAAGTRLQDINDAHGSRPREMIGNDDDVYFVATVNKSDGELWRSDGTAGGTEQLTSLLGDQAPEVSVFEGLFPRLDIASSAGDNVYFLERYLPDTNVASARLWGFDTVGQTANLLADIPNASPAELEMAVLADGRSVFPNSDDTGSKAPWVTDGTAAGTFSINDVASSPRSLASSGGLVYFSASDAVNGRELWRTDGTPDGTFVLTDIRAGSAGSSPDRLTDVNGTLFFRAADEFDTDGFFAVPMLWRLDDNQSDAIRMNAEGTSEGRFPQSLTPVGSTVMYAAFGSDGRELWASDGTLEGTRLVRDIHPGINSSRLHELTAVGEQLFFTADDGVHGSELWVSDGTTSGTELVRDIGLGAASSAPSDLTAFGPFLVFSASDSAGGRELWVSNGTRRGTIRLTDIAPLARSAAPRDLAVVGDTLFFAADDGQIGVELWQLAQLNDVDNDSVSNDVDNCSFAANATQVDTDSDGFGNACDADFNNDCVVNVVDLGYLRSVFFTADALADLNGDGTVNVQDLGLLRSMFFEGPGPSGVAASCSPAASN